MSAGDARRAAEAAARASYGRLVAILAARSRDLAAAEDALSEAFAAALRVWPERGVPDRPEAWLLTAARRAEGHGRRAAAVRLRAGPELARDADEAAAREAEALPDRRLGLLLACAGPAIDPAARAPLRLQTVLGLDAARIAAAFLVSEAAMAKRLARAKSRIRDAGIPFEVPGLKALAPRLDDALAAVYTAYAAGWDAPVGDEAAGTSLAAEALWLARLIAALLPAKPEPKGLLALILYCEARRPARRGADGANAPLSVQDPRLWSRDALIAAEAARAGRFGRFQCEAAIQSVHCQRAATGRTDWDAILRLYDLLLDRAPSLGAAVARAAALAAAGRTTEAAAALDALPEADVAAYQPYWATRAEICAARGAAAEAAAVRARDPAVRAFLAARATAEDGAR